MRADRVWSVVDTPDGLEALLKWLNGVGQGDAALRDALCRRRPLLVAAMNARDAAQTFMSALSSSSSSSSTAALPATSSSPSTIPLNLCAFCGGASGYVRGVALAHDPISHISYPLGAGALAAARAAFATTVSESWAAAPAVARAIAIVCSENPAPKTIASASALIARACAATATPPASLAAALDPRLRRLKRTALSIANNVDWAKLHSPCSWTPAARAAWTHSVVSSLSLSSLLASLGTLEAALRADDKAAAAATVTPHRAPSDAWLPTWYLQTVPSAAAAAAAPTLAALALRLHALQRATAPKSLAPR